MRAGRSWLSQGYVVDIQNNGKFIYLYLTYTYIHIDIYIRKCHRSDANATTKIIREQKKNATRKENEKRKMIENKKKEKKNTRLT